MLSRFACLPLVALSLLLSGCGDAKPSPTAPTPTPASTALPLPPPPPPVMTGTVASTTGATTDAAVATLQTEVKLDPEKYPQNTPEKALESLAKALESNDLAYQIAWLSTPDFTQRMIEKYKTIAATVAANSDDRHAAGRKMVLETIRKMQATRVTAGATENGVKTYWFRLGDDMVLQFELQPDLRWCWNPKARIAVNAKPAPATTDAPPPAK